MSEVKVYKFSVFNHKTSLPDVILSKDQICVEYRNGDKQWFKNGRCHREDGPAIEFKSGFKEWYYHGKRFYVKSQEEFERFLKLKAFL